MLNKDEVNNEEERIRTEISSLDDEKRKNIFKKAKEQLKDPDTYAVLNWFFITGLHHFYLKKWINGLVNLSFFITGIVCMFFSYWEIGFYLILFISIIELWALFRSQLIVQDFNNKVYQKILNEVR